MKQYAPSTVYHCPAPLCNWAVEQDDFNASKMPMNFVFRKGAPTVEWSGGYVKQIATSMASDVEEALKDHLENHHPIYFSWLKFTNKKVKTKYAK